MRAMGRLLRIFGLSKVTSTDSSAGLARSQERSEVQHFEDLALSRTRLRRLRIESPVHEVAVKPFLPYKP